ncbi:MAG: ABC transporter permease [Acidobacteriota bacterium]|nr:ABC transporter permease [Acidobacteriota bacterium]
MRKLWLIIHREYVVRVRTRTFIVSTVGLPAVMIALLVVPAYFASRHSQHTVDIAIVDQAGGLASLAAKRLETHSLPNGEPEFTVVKTFETPADPSSTLDVLRKQVLAGKIDGFLLFPSDVLTGASAEFHTRNPGDFAFANALADAATQAAIGGRLAQERVHVSDLDRVLKPVKMDVEKISGQGETREKGQTFQAAMLLAIILYSSLLMYGITTMRSIQEEKSTRVMEILLSSVRPFPLLAGKILGVGAVGFTQYLIWALAGAGVLTYGAVMLSAFSAGGAAFHLHFPLGLWFWFVMYFLGGYLLFASLFAAVGAAVSSEQDAAQAQIPITMLLVVSFVMFPVVARNPGSHLSVALTMVPFFSPILMVLRIALDAPPLWQLLLSFGLLAATTVVMVYLSAKIYRVGVLMYGKRPTLVEMIRWLRYT